MQKDLRSLMRDPNRLQPEKQDLLGRIADQAAFLKTPCYLLGGVVRDLLLEKTVRDIDIVVEGSAIQFGNRLQKKFGGRLTVHQKFHTCLWHVPESWHLVPDTLDLISARSETYESPGTLPTVKLSTIQDDIRRRDFTINAMAVRLDGDHYGELFDPLDGQRDLDLGMIRILHPRSFIDDPTRLFRAIRHEQRYGFKIEPDTLKLFDQDSFDALANLSGERIRHEFDLIFEEEESARMLARAEELGLFGIIQPGLPGLNEKYVPLLNSVPPDDFGILADRVLLGYVLWLNDITAEILSHISRRLDFSSAPTDTALAGIQLKNDLSSLHGSRPSAWTIRLDKVPAQAIYALWLVSNEPSLKKYLTNWRHVKPHITGNDLKQRGLQPGPRYKEILLRLRAAWLDGEVTSVQDELSLLDKLI